MPRATAAKLAPVESTLTERYQTTVPTQVRKALGLEKHDKIKFTIDGRGRVLITRVRPRERLPGGDEVMGKFFEFLDRDIRERPESIQPISAKLADRVRSLVEGVEVDLDAPLPEEDE
jgi:antitoxin PrlF